MNIAIIGLGYVGLPLALAFSRKHKVYGYDMSQSRIEELRRGVDKTRELKEESLIELKNIEFVSSIESISETEVFIVTVPTPIDRFNKPDLSFLKTAMIDIGGVLKKGDFVICESTVFPGATEEICIPLLQETSGLSINKDFYIGYSPERINPGDPEKRLENIVKVTSGSNDYAANFVDGLYNEIIQAGTFRAKDIRTAEAAKVIENVQRDVNIALMNELSNLLSKLNLSTYEILEASRTKWNFLDFRPGLVGGHCIGIDPFYLLHKASEVNFHSELISASRRINDSMASVFVSKLLKILIAKNYKIGSISVLVCGVTFKPNCPDTRNSKVLDFVDELSEYCANIDLVDPYSDLIKENLKKHKVYPNIPDKQYEAIVLAVSHKEFLELGKLKIRKYLKKGGVIFDFQQTFDSSFSDITI